VYLKHSEEAALLKQRKKEKIAPFRETRSSKLISSFVIGSRPVASMCFSINRFSYKCPLLVHTTGTSGTVPDTAGKQVI
jgi:hypothetical protein